MHLLGDKPESGCPRYVAACNSCVQLRNQGKYCERFSDVCMCAYTGVIDQRGAYAEVGANIHPRLPNGEHRTADTEALTLRVRGDGNVYACAVTTRE